MGKIALRRLILAAVLVAFIPLAAEAQNPARECASGAPDAVIRGCTAVLAKARGMPARQRAAVFSNRGFGYASKGDHDRAIRDYSEALSLDPRHVSAYNNRAYSYSEKGDFDRALRDFDDALRLDPKRAVALNGRGFAHAAKGDHESAVRDFNAAIALNPKYAAAFKNRGESLIQQGDYDRAIRDFDEVIRFASKSGVGHVYRGMALAKKGEHDRALRDLDVAVRLDPRQPTAYNERGSVHHAKAEYGRALLDFDQAIRLEPKFASAYGNRGFTHFMMGNPALALQDLNEAVQLDPQNPAALNNRGFVYSAGGDYDRAIADFNEAMRHNDRVAAVYNHRGAAYREKGELERAIRDLSQAIELDPAYAWAYVNRGQAYEARGDKGRARADYQAALTAPARNAAGRTAHETARTRVAALDSPPVAEPPAVSPPAVAAPPAVVAQPAVAAPVAPLAVAAPAAPPATPALLATPAPAPQGGTFGLASDANPDRRVALVIGNAGYSAVAALQNPQRDADAVAAMLRKIGFQAVKLENDLPRDKLVSALRSFARDSERADWAVVYYAGHGIEIGGVNYLIPTDARLETDRDAQYEAIPLDQVLGAVEGAKKLRLIVLDACRDNPFTQRMRRTFASRSIGRGLGRIEPEGGTMVAYAARAGEIALDGDEANSPFVTALLKHMPTPGMEIGKLFRWVRDDVMAATRRRQEPYLYGSLPAEDLFFVAPK